MTTQKQEDKGLQVDSQESFQVNSDPTIAKGVYSNLAVIKHTDNEFVFDFIFTDSSQGHLVSRVITNPTHAKLLLKALQENVKKYEKKSIKQ